MDTSALKARIEEAREGGAEIETGGPASPGAVDELEKALGTALPSDYRTFLLTFGWMNRGGDSTISGIVDGTNYSRHGGTILSDTNVLRTESGLPPGLLVLECHEDGAYCLDLGNTRPDGTCPVVNWEIGWDRGEKVSDSFDEFLFEFFLAEED